MKNSFACALLGACLLGAFAVPNAGMAEAESASPASAESTYVGKWQVKDTKGESFFITLKPGGEAESSWAGEENARRAQQGTWEALEDMVVITWNNGWRETLSQSGDGFVKKAYRPKWKLDGKPANESPAEKVN